MSAPRPPTGAHVAFWIVFGALVPALAFLVDLELRVNPLLWSTGDVFGGTAPGQRTDGLGLRQLTVYALTALPPLGLLLLTRRTPGRVSNACALALVTLGVLVACAHALVFVPLLPLSLLGLVVGIGVLGFTPFLAVWVYCDAGVFAVQRQAELCPGALRWTVGPLVALHVALVLALAPLLQQQRGLLALRQAEDARTARAALRELGWTLSLSQSELRALYPDLSAQAQVRLRAHLIEVTGEDPTPPRWR